MVSYPRHYAIQCPSNELSDAQSLAWAAIFLYPVGVVLLSAWLLYLSRQALLLEEQSTPYTRSIAFLHAPFVPKFFYFELLELTKKLLLIGFASACHQSESNPVLQLSTCSPHTRVPFSSFCHAAHRTRIPPANHGRGDHLSAIPRAPSAVHAIPEAPRQRSRHDGQLEPRRLLHLVYVAPDGGTG